MRRVATCLCVTVLLAVGLTACQPARAGARCRTTELGHDANFVLKCHNGRWLRAMTKADAARLIAAIIAAKSAPTTTAPPPQVDPLTQRLISTVHAVFGPTIWAGQVTSVPWSVVPTDPSSAPGTTHCRYTTRNGRLVSATPSVTVQAHAVDASDQALGDLVAHEGAHVIACLRWADLGSAPPGWPVAKNGARPAESYADCLGRHIRGPAYYQFYGCPSDDHHPMMAAQFAAG